MQLTETARCVTHLQPARIESETLQLSETVAQLHLAEIQGLGSRISHIQPAPECVSCNQQTLKDLQRSK